MPGLERLPQFELHAAGGEVAIFREAEFEVRREPLGLQRVAIGLHVRHHIHQVLFDEVRHQKTVVQFRPPTRQRLRRVRPLPETRHHRPQQQLLSQAHARMWWHLECAHFQEAESPRRTIGRIQLVDAEFRAVGIAGDVDQQIAQQPVHQPRRHRVARLRGIGVERQLHFVQRIVARLVRLAAPARSAR